MFVGLVGPGLAEGSDISLEVSLGSKSTGDWMCWRYRIRSMGYSGSSRYRTRSKWIKGSR